MRAAAFLNMIIFSHVLQFSAPPGAHTTEEKRVKLFQGPTQAESNMEPKLVVGMIIRYVENMVRDARRVHERSASDKKQSDFEDTGEMPMVGVTYLLLAILLASLKRRKGFAATTRFVRASC